MNHFRTLALASAALLITGSAFAAPPNSSINGLAAGNVPVTLGAVSDGTLKSPTHGVVDSTGAVVDPATSALQTSANTKLDTLHSDNSLLSTAANQAALTGSKAGGTAATSSELVGGVYNSSAPALTTGQQASAQLDASGNLKVNVIAGGAGGGAVYGPTAVGSAAANPPVLLGGTITGAATGNVGVAKVTADGLVHVSIDSGGGSGGTSSSFAAAFPATGTAIGAKNGSNMVNLTANASGGLIVDGSAVTQPVSIAGTVAISASSLPLPTGAATSATQALTQGSKAPGTAASNADLVGCVYTSAGVTLTTGQQVALQCNSTGQLITSGSGGGGGAITAASGAYAAGAFAAGAGVDGWDLTQGAKGDSAYAGSGSASVVAILKGLYASSTGSIPAGTAVIGHVIADSGSTTAVTALPALPAGTNTLGATYSFQGSSGNVLPAATSASAPINVSTATTTQLVALSAGKLIHVTSYDVIAGGTGNITFEYGTGTNCGTGTTILTGAYNLAAQAGIAKGNGLGDVLVVPSGNALCVLTSAAVQMSGSVSYAQY